MILSKQVTWASGQTSMQDWVSVHNHKPIGIVLPATTAGATLNIRLRKNGVESAVRNADGAISITIPQLTERTVIIFPSDIIFGCEWANEIKVTSSVAIYSSDATVEVLLWDGK